MDDSLSALQFTKVIEKEMLAQSKWMEAVDLSNARPIPPEMIYHSMSLTQQPTKFKEAEKSPSFRPSRSLTDFNRAKANMGFVYPSLRNLKAHDDPRVEKTIFGAKFEPIPDVFIAKERFPNGHKLYQDSHRTSGVFGAVIEK